MVISIAAGSIKTLQNQFFLSECLGKICTVIHDLAIGIINAIKSCFGYNSNQASLYPRNVSVQGPLNLIAFYRGQEPNNNGVTLDQILNFDDGRLETAHNYIQWLFPLRTPSGPNPTAATLDDQTIHAFQTDLALKNQVLRSFRRMLSFYGLQMNETTRAITRAPNFNARAQVWLFSPAGHHNFLRITRILNSLALLRCTEYMHPFFHILNDIYQREGRGIISAETYNYWDNASVCNASPLI